MNFVKLSLDHGGDIKPLLIDSNLTNGTGLFNPSIFVDGEDIFVNIRHCQYTLYHSELNNYEHQYGPLVYLNPENDRTLTTTNYICKLDKNLDTTKVLKVNTSKLDQKPLWEFVGLEDARIVKWDQKYYLCGVRRDTTTHGQGRMELSEIQILEDTVEEISRQRIPAPGKNDSYCEKNWMPILDQPFCFVKWTNPTEVVKYDVDNKTCETIHLGNFIRRDKDLRGGTQVIPWKDGYLTLNHETNLYRSEAGRKNATYRHRFTFWDKNWNVNKISEEFSFMEAKIEFACGMSVYGDYVLITFGFQDNASYVLKTPIKLIEDMLND
jgi:predicted GH43/DUF377 family glycosyl hydrolase